MNSLSVCFMNECDRRSSSSIGYSAFLRFGIKSGSVILCYKFELVLLTNLSVNDVIRFLTCTVVLESRHLPPTNSPEGKIARFRRGNHGRPKLC